MGVCEAGNQLQHCITECGNSSDSLDKKAHLTGGGLSGQGQNPLLLTPASLQLAQLQAQLTLQRLKLAQSAVGNNTAAAATVLNQVLSNVAMSQPLFNPLRNPAQTPNPGFPTGAIPFPPPNSALGTLVGGGFPPNPSAIRLNHCGGSTSQTTTQHAGDYGKKAGAFLADTDRRSQFGYLGGVSVTSTKVGDGQYGGVSTETKSGVQSGFQKDYYTPEAQQTGFGGNSGGVGSGDQTLDGFPASGHKEPWKNLVNFPHAGKMDMTSGTGGNAWVGVSGQPFRPRGELYNPEEPTLDSKFTPMGGPGFSSAPQGFAGYPQLQTAGEETPLTAAPTPLQPHQLNDFHGVTPSHLPHHCTICEKKVYNLKDWDQHVKGKLHLQNCTLYTESPATGAVHFPVPTEGCLNQTLNNAMHYPSSVGQDVSAGPNASYLPATAMKSFPLSGAGFTSQPGSKFSPRKVCPGRVVHICNLPEGSCTENDVINLGLPFGKVTNYILMRSTHQAFLEMAYVEAAHAMVKYYQLQPATINDQKLLIRMSKRYKELQLKKPGKDVASIIQDINSQRERDEMQEIDRYLPERARSRSPISRSLSPRSHSPSFTSCSSAHSPQGAPCNRPDWSNGMGSSRVSWDWSSHPRRDEERDRDREELGWRNGEEDRLNGRLPLPDRRKTYLKPGDRVSPRSGMPEERGVRDWYPRSSPQGPPFSSYRSMEDFYKKEPPYKAEKPPRPPYQRHEMKSKRREGPDYHRSRHSESDLSEDLGRSKKTSRKAATEKEEEREQEDNRETSSRVSKERSESPQSGKHTEPEKDKESEAEEWESGDDTEGEFWYPKNMEELVTVDEVGEEDDSIIEPDLPELQEEAAVEHQAEGPTQHASSPKPSTEQAELGEQIQENRVAGEQAQEESSAQPSPGGLSVDTSSTVQSVSELSHFPGQEFKAALEETCSSNPDSKTPNAAPTQEPVSGHECVCEGAQDAQKTSDTEKSAAADGRADASVHNSLSGHSPSQIHIEAASPSQGQERVISEHTIPLGVEFIVPRTGFYCKLCGLFYTSEETAKTTHCRSAVHYRNLQKYLSQLAQESFLNFHTDPTAAE
ncbi:RNA-binding protein 20 [Chanos chanos]|uniref:RNA-binding protein 20 n=1 Tax=Chanos chanos TaxID=29144 RepID=A0A6J2W5U1_CHACN|nr:RNA-binding protein 20 [Chanos chanos]